jgi:sulfur carrier protein ThiS
MGGIVPRVNVEFVGPIRRPWREHQRAVDLPDGASVADLVSELGYSDREREHLSVLVNAERAKPSVVLDDEDSVVVTIIVGGG